MRRIPISERKDFIIKKYFRSLSSILSAFIPFHIIFFDPLSSTYTPPKIILIHLILHNINIFAHLSTIYSLSRHISCLFFRYIFPKITNHSPYLEASKSYQLSMALWFPLRTPPVKPREQSCQCASKRLFTRMDNLTNPEVNASQIIPLAMVVSMCLCSSSWASSQVKR